jgi:hypothetical protein
MQLFLWKLNTCTLFASFAWFSLSIFSGVMKWLESTVSTPWKIRMHDQQWKWATSYNHYYKIHQQLEVTSFFQMKSTCILLPRNFVQGLSNNVTSPKIFIFLRNLRITIYILYALRGKSFYVSANTTQSQLRPHQPHLIDCILNNIKYQSTTATIIVIENLGYTIMLLCYIKTLD